MNFNPQNITKIQLLHRLHHSQPAVLTLVLVAPRASAAASSPSSCFSLFPAVPGKLSKSQRGFFLSKIEVRACYSSKPSNYFPFSPTEKASIL